ncbi:MAG: hypothetical protein AAFO09_01350 [Pseudomonadota bacterium]
MEKYFREYTREITPSRAIRIIKYIQSASFDNRDYCLYARGDTFKSRQEIQLLETKLPIEIKTIESTKKGVWKVIPIPSPKYFVIKINKFDVLEDFYKSINDISIMTFCIFDKSIESNFLRRMAREKQATYIEPMYQDSSYFAYGIDTDDQESESGFREFVSYGINAPRELIGFL